MPRPEKVQAVEEIKERFSDASASFITEFRGLTVSQQQTLRNALRKAGASYTVFKMSLTRRALDELGHNELDEYLVGPTAIAFASEDPVPVAKALEDFGADHEALVIKAGWLNGEVIAPEVVAKLAGLGSRGVLLAMIVGAIKAPLTKMAGMLGSMTRDAASMFSQLLDQKLQDAPPTVEPEPAPETVPDEVLDAAATDETPAAEEDSVDNGPSEVDNGPSEDVPQADAYGAAPEGDGERAASEATDEAVAGETPAETDQEERVPDSSDEAPTDEDASGDDSADDAEAGDEDGAESGA